MIKLLFLVSIFLGFTACSMENIEPSKTNDLEDALFLDPIELMSFGFSCNEDYSQSSMSGTAGETNFNGEKSALMSENFDVEDLTADPRNMACAEEFFYDKAAEMIQNNESCSCGFSTPNCESLEIHLQSCERFLVQQQNFFQNLLEAENPEMMHERDDNPDSISIPLESHPNSYFDQDSGFVGEISNPETIATPQDVCKDNYLSNNDNHREHSEEVKAAQNKVRRKAVFNRDVLYKKCACGDVFDTGNELAEHVKALHKRKVGNKLRFVCPAVNCGNVQTNLHAMLDHFGYQHTDEQVSYNCQFCSHGARSYRALMRHERNHEEGSTSSKKRTIGIKRKHKREIIQKQCACGEEFARGKKLLSHVKKVHWKKNNKNKKRYSCPVEGCTKKPSEIYTTLDHYANKHTHEEVILPCETCAKEFGSYQSLKRHERIHAKKKKKK
jgi:hypothetical protein